jgi:hypothetical protein
MTVISQEQSPYEIAVHAIAEAAKSKGYELVESVGEYLYRFNSVNRTEGLLNLLWIDDDEFESSLRDAAPLSLHKPPHIFWPIFLEFWNACDCTWDYVFEFRMLLSHCHNDGETAYRFYDSEQKAFFDKLESVVTIYRGCNRDQVNGLAWTTDRRIAEGFARGHRGIFNPDPVIAVGLVLKSDIYAVITSRNESEVVCEPVVVDVEEYQRS